MCVSKEHTCTHVRMCVFICSCVWILKDLPGTDNNSVFLFFFREENGVWLGYRAGERFPLAVLSTL